MRLVRLQPAAGLAALLIGGGWAEFVAAQRADTVVKMAATPVHRDVATLVREVSIGLADGADEYMMGSISEIAVARDGAIYVYDRQVPALRKYDANGKYIKTFGRKGQGPGEYLNAGGLGILPDGRVLLWDSGNWRVNVYATDGTVMPSWSTASGVSGSVTVTTSPMVVDTAGRVYVRRNLFGPTRVRRTVWISYSPNGSVIDTLPVPEFSTSVHELSATSSGGNSSVSMPVPFSALSKSVLSPLGYFVTGVPDRYAFEIHAAPRGPVVSVRRDAKAAPVTSQERDSARRAIEERMRQTDALWRWSGPDIPKTKPYYGDLAMGDDGRIWVPVIPEQTPGIGRLNTLGRSGAGRQAPPPPSSTPAPEPKPRAALYDVFEPNGTYLGQVEVPPRVATAVRRGDYVWGIEFGDDDLQKVVRFRIGWR